MDILMKLPIKVSSATGNFIIGVTAAASAGVYFSRGQFHPLIATPVALGALLGSLVGPRLLIDPVASLFGAATEKCVTPRNCLVFSALTHSTHHSS